MQQCIDSKRHRAGRAGRALPQLACRLSAPVIVALTGDGQARHRELSNQAGIALHLTKPLEIATLGKLLKAVGRREASAIDVA